MTISLWYVIDDKSIWLRSNQESDVMQFVQYVIDSAAPEDPHLHEMIVYHFTDHAAYEHITLPEYAAAHNIRRRTFQERME